VRAPAPGRVRFRPSARQLEEGGAAKPARTWSSWSGKAGRPTAAGPNAASTPGPANERRAHVWSASPRRWRRVQAIRPGSGEKTARKADGRARPRASTTDPEARTYEDERWRVPSGLQRADGDRPEVGHHPQHGRHQTTAPTPGQMKPMMDEIEADLGPTAQDPSWPTAGFSTVADIEPNASRGHDGVHAGQGRRETKRRTAKDPFAPKAGPTSPVIAEWRRRMGTEAAPDVVQAACSDGGVCPNARLAQSRHLSDARGVA